MSAPHHLTETVIPVSWRELVMPKEHGSWAFAFEPIVLGLLIAPSLAGGWLALAMTATFFARRPLRTALSDSRPGHRVAARRALIACGAGACFALIGAIASGGFGWLAWLLPPAAAGAVFLRFDLRKEGREGVAEVAGVAAFACLPAALVAAGGRPAATAVAAAVVMLGRAVPTVLCVRACLRAAKTGVHRATPALTAAFLALGAGLALAFADLAPPVAVGLLALLAVRAAFLLVFPRPSWLAKTIGMIEAVLGIAFVLSIGIAWHR